MSPSAPASPSQPPARHHLLVCTTCGSQWVNGQKEGISQGEILLDKLQALAWDPDWSLKPVECMSGCSHACVVGFAAAHKTTYIFGDLEPEQADVIQATAQLYLSKPDGTLPWAERPLKKGIIARIPVLD